MAVNMGRGIGSDIREQFLTLKVMANNIKSQEQFLMMVDRQDIIPDMARRLSKEAVSSDLISNKRVLLDFLYNMLVRTGPDEPHMDVEFHYIIIGKGFLKSTRVFSGWRMLNFQSHLKLETNLGKK